MDLLERDEALGSLTRAATAAARGQGGMVVVSGESGAGKTTLLSAFERQAPKDMRFLQGACEDLSVPEALAPLYDLARGADWDLSAALRRAERQIEVFDEALDVFARNKGGTVLVIEDIHWADEATLDLLRFIARRLRSVPVLLVATARNEALEAQTHLRRLVADVPTDSLTRIELPTLSRAAVGRLVAGTGHNADEVFRATGGNAFYVTEFLQSGLSNDPPRGVVDTVLARADRLEPAARAVLDLVSVFPRRAEVSMVEELTPDPAMIEVCLDSGLLFEEPGFLRFRHEIARRALESALPPRKVRSLNAAIVKLLGDGADVPLAHRLHHARGAGDAAEVRRLAPLASEEAARLGAHREVVANLELVMDDLDNFDPETRVTLLERYAFATHFIGDLTKPIEKEEQALAILRQIDGAETAAGESLLRLSRYNYIGGDRGKSVRCAEEARAMLEPYPGPELAMAYSTLSQLAMLNYEHRKAMDFGEKAIELAEGLNRGSDEIICHALNNMGTSKSWQIEPGARELLDKSLELALEGGHVDHVARAYINLLCLEVYEQNYEAVETLYAAANDYHQKYEISSFLTYMGAWRAEALQRRGLWDEAASEAERLAVHGDKKIARFTALCALTKVRMRRGEPISDKWVDDLGDILRNMAELDRLMTFATVIADRAWLGLGSADKAIRFIDSLTITPETRTPLSEAAFWRKVLDPDWHTETDDRVPATFRLAIEGDWMGAAEAWRKVGAPYERALCLTFGPPEAQLQALEIFDDLGATVPAQRLRQKLRDEGHRAIPAGPRQSTRENPEGLTKRQMDVLRLLNEGRSNAEIAETLYVSPKTVDHHVSAILGKLEVSTRAEAAARARAEGWV